MLLSPTPQQVIRVLARVVVRQYPCEKEEENYADVDNDTDDVATDVGCAMLLMVPQFHVHHVADVETEYQAEDVTGLKSLVSREFKHVGFKRRDADGCGVHETRYQEFHHNLH